MVRRIRCGTDQSDGGIASEIWRLLQSDPRSSGFRPKPPHQVVAMEPWRRQWIYSSLCGSPSLAVRHHSYRS